MQKEVEKKPTDLHLLLNEPRVSILFPIAELNASGAVNVITFRLNFSSVSNKFILPFAKCNVIPDKYILRS